MSIEKTSAPRGARWWHWTLAATAAAALAIASGCVTVDDKGDDDGSGSSGGGNGAGSGNGSGAGNGTGNPTGGGTYECCLPSGNYSCPDEAAFDACAGFDIDGCLDGCALDDFTCQEDCFDQLFDATHDPSGCTADASVDCNSTGSGPSGPGATSGPGPSSSSGGPQCSEILSGCDYDDDCCSNNCAGNTCYGNSFGDPCEYDDDCDSTNCYDGICQ